jgi:hypothetical protein
VTGAAADHGRQQRNGREGGGILGDASHGLILLSSFMRSMI